MTSVVTSAGVVRAADRLVRLQSLTETRDRLADTLTSELQTVEQEWVRLGLRTVASVRIQVSPTEDYELTYGRRSNGWGFSLKRVEGSPPAEAVTELAHASRSIRILVATHLQDLLDAVVQKTEVEIQETEAAIASLNAFTRAIVTVVRDTSGRR